MEQNVDKKLFFILLISQFIVYITNTVYFKNSLTASVLFLIGFFTIMYRYRKTKKIVTPINIFSFIWLILVSITSFSFPLMREMNQWDWSVVLIFNMCFSLSGLLMTFYKSKKQMFSNNQNQGISQMGYFLGIILILLGIGVHLYQVFVFGGFVLFSDNPSQESSTYMISGLSTISTMGSLGIFYVFTDQYYRKKILYILLSLLYLILLLLVGVRFQIFLTVIMMMSCISFKNFKIKQKILFFFGVLTLIFVFLFIASYRSSLQRANYYFVQTGIYHGNASDIYWTEIFRYFGYGYRLTNYYWTNYSPAISQGAYTMYPLAHLLHIPLTTPERIWENGYVATSVIVYLYCDFGELWPIFAFLFSLIINASYYIYISHSNLMMSKYFWALGCFSLTMSFYAYFHHYIYLIVYFPLVLCIIKLLTNTWKSHIYIKDNFLIRVK